MDIGVGEGLAFLGSSPLVTKLLGPTFEYFGDGLKKLTEKRLNNLRRIFDNAKKYS